MTNEKRDVNPEIDTTRFVNIDKEEAYDIYINGKVARHLNSGEEQIVPLWVAQAGAKHLVDKILQRDYNIKDTFKDTELRKSLFAQILPDMAEERNIQPLTLEQTLKEVQEQLKKQDNVIASIRGEAQGAVKVAKSKDDEIKQLEERIKELEKDLSKKPGRPTKGVTLPTAKDIKLKEEEK